MVGEIIEMVAEVIGALFSSNASGKSVFWGLVFAAVIIGIALAIVAHSENECSKKGGQIVEINGVSQCVEKVKKL